MATSDTTFDPRRPGDVHFIGEMNTSSLLVDLQRSIIQAPLTDEVRSPGGGAPLGMLVTLFDVAASQPALAACSPDWTATQDLSMHAAAWLTEGPIVVDNHLVRVGTKVVIVAARAYDGLGLDDFEELRAAIDAGGLPLAATGLLSFARLPRSAASGVDDHDPASWVGEVRRNDPTSVEAGSTIYSRMGLRTVDAASGQIELDRTGYVANSIGTINGGAQAILIEAAAEAACPGLTARDMQVHYLSQVKAGPARSRATVLRRVGDHGVVDVELVDAGHDEQLLAVATVTLERPPPGG